MKLTCQSCLDVADEEGPHWCFQRAKAGERDVFSPEHEHKGRRQSFPQDQTMLVPKVHSNAEHPQGATKAWAGLDLPGQFGPPLLRGQVCCQVALCGCTKGTLTGRTDTEKLEKLKAEEHDPLGLLRRSAEHYQGFVALNAQHVLSISAGCVRPVLRISKRKHRLSFVQHMALQGINPAHRKVWNIHYSLASNSII